MKKLITPYRNTPSDAKCLYKNGNTQFFNSLHQQNLFLRHYAADHENLLSMRLICRTLAMPGDWHRRINPDFLNITYIHSGDTFVRINDKSFLAEPGDLILVDSVFEGVLQDRIGIILEDREDYVLVAEGNFNNISAIVTRKKDNHIRAVIHMNN